MPGLFCFCQCRLHVEVQLAIVAVIDSGDGLVRHSGAVRAIEQAPQFVADAIYADIFPGTVAPKLRQPGGSEIPLTAPFPPPCGENYAGREISSLSARIRFAGFRAEKDGGKEQIIRKS